MDADKYLSHKLNTSGTIHCQETGSSSNDTTLLNNKPYHFLSPNVAPGRPSTSFNYEGEYSNSHKRRGIAIIINNGSFENETLPDRKGAENDTIHLERCFNKLGFDTRVGIDLTRFETEQTLKNVAIEMNREQDFDCFVLAISSHGEMIKKKGPQKSVNEDIINCVDEYMPTNNILRIFSDKNCPGLKGKPRLCFIQACRGTKLDAGVHMGENVTAPLEEIDARLHSNSRKIISTPFPCMADFLVMYATPAGFHAFRRTEQGSWFITALTNVLENITESRCDINKILRLVIKRVAYGYRSYSNNTDHDNKRQVPCIHSMLTKSFYLAPKK